MAEGKLSELHRVAEGGYDKLAYISSTADVMADVSVSKSDIFELISCWASRSLFLVVVCNSTASSAKASTKEKH